MSPEEEDDARKRKERDESEADGQDLPQAIMEDDPSTRLPSTVENASSLELDKEHPHAGFTEGQLIQDLFEAWEAADQEQKDEDTTAEARRRSSPAHMARRPEVGRALGIIGSPDHQVVIDGSGRFYIQYPRGSCSIYCRPPLNNPSAPLQSAGPNNQLLSRINPLRLSIRVPRSAPFQSGAQNLLPRINHNHPLRPFPVPRPASARSVAKNLLLRNINQGRPSSNYSWKTDPKFLPPTGRPDAALASTFQSAAAQNSTATPAPAVSSGSRQHKSGMALMGEDSVRKRDKSVAAPPQKRRKQSKLLADGHDLQAREHDSKSRLKKAYKDPEVPRRAGRSLLQQKEGEFKKVEDKYEMRNFDLNLTPEPQCSAPAQDNLASGPSITSLPVEVRRALPGIIDSLGLISIPFQHASGQTQLLLRPSIDQSVPLQPASQNQLLRPMTDPFQSAPLQPAAQNQLLRPSIDQYWRPSLSNTDSLPRPRPLNSNPSTPLQAAWTGPKDFLNIVLPPRITYHLRPTNSNRPFPGPPSAPFEYAAQNQFLPTVNIQGRPELINQSAPSARPAQNQLILQATVNQVRRRESTSQSAPSDSAQNQLLPTVNQVRRPESTSQSAPSDPAQSQLLPTVNPAASINLQTDPSSVIPPTGASQSKDKSPSDRYLSFDSD